MSPERAGAWINATANVGIAGGSAVGAGLLHTAGLWSLPWVGASLMGLGLRRGRFCLATLFRHSLERQPAALGRSGGQLPCASTASSKCQISLA